MARYPKIVRQWMEIASGLIGKRRVFFRWPFCIQNPGHESILVLDKSHVPFRQQRLVRLLMHS